MVRSSCTLIGRAENCVVKDWIGLHFTFFYVKERYKENKIAKIMNMGLVCGNRHYVITLEIISFWSSSSFSLTRKIMQRSSLLFDPFSYEKKFQPRGRYDFCRKIILELFFFLKKKFVELNLWLTNERAEIVTWGNSELYNLEHQNFYAILMIFIGVDFFLQRFFLRIFFSQENINL